MGFPEWTCLECFRLLFPASWRLTILTFAGKDATVEFDMTHSPDEYSSGAVIGVVGGCRARNVWRALKSALFLAWWQFDRTGMLATF